MSSAKRPQGQDAATRLHDVELALASLYGSIHPGRPFPGGAAAVRAIGDALLEARSRAYLAGEARDAARRELDRLKSRGGKRGRR